MAKRRKRYPRLTEQRRQVDLDARIALLYMRYGAVYAKTRRWYPVRGPVIFNRPEPAAGDLLDILPPPELWRPAGA